jgi:methyl-accepting chemotaxis protein
VPLSDQIRTVGDVLSRADALFGTVDPDAATSTAAYLTDAASAIRSGQDLAASMTGDTVTGYSDFAHSARDALDRLSGADADLGHHLQAAAEAVTAASAASKSALDTVSSASDAVDHVTHSPALEIAVLHALRAQVGRQLELIRTQQAIAEQLSAHLRGLGY